MTKQYSGLRGAFVSQFKQPRGLLGRLAGYVLAWRPSNRARNVWTVGLLAVERSSRVLEIGCGPGVALQHLLRKYPEAMAVGIDRSDVMIAQASARNRAAIKSKRLTLVHGDIKSLSDSPQNFDRAFSINVIQFVDGPAEFAAALARLVKPGGVVATALQPRGKTASAEAAQLRLEAFGELLAKSGFANSRVEILDLKPVPALCLLMTKSKA